MVHFVRAKRQGGLYCKRGWQSHVWLEAGGLIVDITCDQYAEAPGPVIVAASSPWHDTFQTQARSSYAEMMQMSPSDARRFERIYGVLVGPMATPAWYVPVRRPEPEPEVEEETLDTLLPEGASA